MLKSNSKNDLSEVCSVRSVAGLNWTGKLYRPSDLTTQVVEVLGAVFEAHASHTVVIRDHRIPLNGSVYP